MARANADGQRGGVGRLGTAAAVISAVCCLPYLVLKVAWTFDVPIGIADRSVLHDTGWAAANAVMGALGCSACCWCWR